MNEKEMLKFTVKYTYYIRSISRAEPGPEFEESVLATRILPWNGVTISSISVNAEDGILVVVEKPFVLKAQPDGTARIVLFEGKPSKKR